MTTKDVADGQLPLTPAGRLQMLSELTRPRPVFDDNGEPTGEMSEPLMSIDEAIAFLQLRR